MSTTANVTFGVMPNGTDLILSTQNTTAYGNGDNLFQLTEESGELGVSKAAPYWGAAIAPNTADRAGNTVRTDIETEFKTADSAGTTYVKVFFANTVSPMTASAKIITQARTIVGGTVNMTLTGSSIVGGYEAKNNGSDIDIHISNLVQAQANVPYLGFEVTGPRNIEFYDIDNTAEELGIQAIAFGLQEPASCFGPSTTVHVKHTKTIEEWCPIETLSGNVHVETMTPEGETEWIWCQVIREHTVKPTSSAYALKAVEPPVWLSRVHYLLVPERYGDKRDGDEPENDKPKNNEPKGDEPKGDEWQDDLVKPKEEWICTACQTHGVYGEGNGTEKDKAGCPRCGPFTVNGYRGVLAGDVSERYSQRKVVDFWQWYHLVPVDSSKSTNALVLENGCLAELYRSSLSKAEARGFVLV